MQSYEEKKASQWMPVMARHLCQAGGDGGDSGCRFKKMHKVSVAN